MIESPLLKTLNEMVSGLDQKGLAEVFRSVSFESKESYGPHNHQRIEMNYIKKGSCILSLDNESVLFKENDLMIISSNTSHFFEAGTSGCTLIQLEFLPEQVLQMDNDIFKSMSFDIFSTNNEVIKVVNNVRIMRAIQRIIAEMSSQRKFYQQLVLMYYMELLILIHRYMSENYLPICSNETMKQAILYIQQKYQNDILIHEMASDLDVSERYLRKIFSKYLNISPNKYLNQIRIHKSIDLLRITELSIKEICFECGFTSPQYFSRVFKQYVGVSPNEFLQQ